MEPADGFCRRIKNASTFESEDLFAVQPAGTDTFANTVTTTSTVGGTASAGSEGTETSDDSQTLPLTDLTTIVTTEQTYHSANDWTVRQSVTNRFDQNAHANSDTEGSDSDNNDATGDSYAGADDTNNGRTGSKTFSITVINGTTTITSFHMSDTFTFSSGSIPGEAESDDPYAIPADWIQQAIKSVNKPAGSDIAIASSTSDDAEEDDEDDTGTSNLPNGSGVFVTASYDVSADVTKSLITLDDGSMAITYTLAIGFSASFSTRAGGHYSISESDLDADALSELDGLAIDASSDFAFFAAGSVAASFTASATLPLSVNLDDADFAASFQFGTSFNAGGTASSTVKATKNESSGSTTADNDVYDRVNIKHKTSASGYFGASFWLGASTESDDTAEDDTAVESYTAGGEELPNDDNAASDEESSPAGSQSATDLIEGNKTGVQFSLAVSGSTSTTDKAKVEWKTRRNGSDNDRYYYQMQDSEKTTSSSDSHLKIEIGTEQMLVDFGISGSDSETIDQKEIDWGYMLNSSLTEYQTVFTVAAYSRNAEGHYNVGLVLGGDDPGLTNSGGYSNDEEARYEEHWPSGTYITTETFHNHGGDVESEEPRRHRRTQQYPTPDGNQVSVDFDNPVIHTSTTPQASMTDVLDEYRTCQERRSSLQAEFDEATNPEMRQFVQDQIDVETATLTKTAQKALAAGATQEQLDEIGADVEVATEEASETDETPIAGTGTSSGNTTDEDEETPGHDGNVIFLGDPENVEFVMELWNQLKERAKDNEKLQEVLNALIQGSNEIKFTIVENSQQTLWGAYEFATIDVADLKALPVGDGPFIQAIEMLLHEVAEQDYKIDHGFKGFKRPEFRKAHSYAVKIEGLIDGWVRASEDERELAGPGAGGQQAFLLTHRFRNEAFLGTVLRATTQYNSQGRIFKHGPLEDLAYKLFMKKNPPQE